jgi:hypothetical protein
MKTQKSYTKLIYFFIILFFFCAGVAMYAKWQQTGTPFVPETILYFCIVFFISTCTGLLAIKVLRYIETKTHLVKQVIPALLVFYIGVYVISYLSITLGVFVWFLIKGRSLAEFFPHLFKYELSAPSSNLMIWLLIATLMFFYILWKKAMDREKKLSEEKLLYQYETLKQQVNPHFLFNSLNTLSSLILANASLADTFINKLSCIYRYILENKDVEFVDLKTEIEFAKDYFYLLQIRDGEKIHLTVEWEEKNRYKILPISLQILIENALKHNLATKESPLRITIKQESDDFITVRNNLQRKINIEHSSLIGLKNLAERIKLITQREMIIKETKEEFIVTIPLITESYASTHYRG